MSAVGAVVDRSGTAELAVSIVPPVLLPPQLSPYSQVPGPQMGLSGFVAFAVWSLQAPQIPASLPPPPDRTYSYLGPHMPLAPLFRFSVSASRKI